MSARQPGRVAGFAVRLVVPLVPIVAIWALAWVLFAISVHHGSGDLTKTWVSAGLVVAGNFYLLLYVFLRTSFRYPPWAVSAGFVFTFLALIGAFASADYVAAHQYVLDAHGRTLVGCYTSASGKAITLRPVDAIYFTLSTVTTAGFGDIAPSSRACRWLTSGELGIGFPLLGLAIGGVAARVFRELVPSESPKPSATGETPRSAATPDPLPTLPATLPRPASRPSARLSSERPTVPPRPPSGSRRAVPPTPKRAPRKDAPPPTKGDVERPESKRAAGRPPQPPKSKHRPRSSD